MDLIWMNGSSEFNVNILIIIYGSGVRYQLSIELRRHAMSQFYSIRRHKHKNGFWG